MGHPAPALADRQGLCSGHFFASLGWGTGGIFVNSAFSASGVATLETTIKKDDRRKINRLDNADLKALLGHDQGDLTAGHHADTD